MVLFCLLPSTWRPVNFSGLVRKVCVCACVLLCWLVGFVCCFVEMDLTIYPWLVYDFLCRLSWLQIHRNLPGSASLMLALKACTMMLSDLGWFVCLALVPFLSCHHCNPDGCFCLLWDIGQLLGHSLSREKLLFIDDLCCWAFYVYHLYFRLFPLFLLFI